MTTTTTQGEVVAGLAAEAEGIQEGEETMTSQTTTITTTLGLLGPGPAPAAAKDRHKETTALSGRTLLCQSTTIDTIEDE
eukprot:CAMPEP_0170498626 /NCGR_PEP_ID=MMETSP0208-20121228/28438_1 /TAXON_ID=197538 /ORGANISM="Strombidium inclinatum, Strain S3" /LENGTH=79 /DNA_ID=CAMNT_0010775861 /DNA_START=12 /DNA_END=248 /DNA_ORIENTATION=+